MEKFSYDSKTKGNIPMKKSENKGKKKGFLFYLRL